MILSAPQKPGAFVRPAFSFIDLFAGIGGLRLPFDALGGHCAFTSEKDKFARETYRANFDCRYHAIGGDITQIPADAIPPHDLLLAGFPCQPFSMAGIGFKNQRGRKTGFGDRTQGTMFFEIVRMLARHRPQAFLLENVKNLLHHDRGKTFEIIRQTLADDLGYQVQWRTLNAKGLVPQSRNRLFIVGFRDACAFDFDALSIVYPDTLPILGDILEPEEDIGDAYTLRDGTYAYVQKRAALREARGYGFSTRYLGPEDTLPTLVASHGADRGFFIKQAGSNPRRLSPRECARAQGFPDSFKIPVSKTQAYRQFGNSVAVPLVMQIAKAMQPYLVDNLSTPVYNSNYDLANTHMPTSIIPAAFEKCSRCGTPA